MPRITPEQVQTLHHLLGEAANAATYLAESLHAYSDVDPYDPEVDMAFRVRTTKALQVRDGLVALLDLLNDDPS